MARSIDTRLICSGCGRELPLDETLPFRCPTAGDGGDHVIVRRFVDPQRHAELLEDALADSEPNPFVRFRRLFHAWHRARAEGMGDEEFVERVASLDDRVARVDGHGFRTTPMSEEDALANALHRPEGSLLVKDETHDVSGSHKARHLMQVGIWLELMKALGKDGPAVEAPLAIASCGNAALAAAVVARAMRRRLLVFVPPQADAAVLDRMRELEAEIEPCPRGDQGPGDPCLHAFHHALEQGAIPFGCQGPENGMVLEGGLGLGYELLGQLRSPRRRISELVLQVGGGALASSVFQAFLEADELRLLGQPLPRLHTVQTEGSHPLQRALRILRQRLEAATRDDPAEAAESILARELQRAAADRGQFMWPWESTPESFATGILDDETYDWRALLEAMERSGGNAVVADEPTLREAHDLSRVTTGIDPCPTGTSGVAGLMTLQSQEKVSPSSRALVIFTGSAR